MDSRKEDALRKCSMFRHIDRNQKSVGLGSRPPQDKISPFRRVRSPPRPQISSSFRPRFGGFYRPRSVLDERVFRKPNFSFGFQRYNHFPPRPQYSWRDKPETRPSASTPSPRSQTNSKQSTAKSSFPSSSSKEYSSIPSLTKASSREKEKPFLCVTDTKGGEKESRERLREIPSTVSQAAARTQAIQQKRREIDEVYRQDCETFGVVVRMLIAKDPSLEPLIQTSLQDNLREIGQRCVDAMQGFITKYDSNEPSSM